jgi:hypothetical protein
MKENRSESEHTPIRIESFSRVSFPKADFVLRRAIPETLSPQLNNLNVVSTVGVLLSWFLRVV